MEANIRFMSDTVILSLFDRCGEYIGKIKVFYIGSKSLTCLYPCSRAMITSMRLFECTAFLRIFTMSWNTGYGYGSRVFWLRVDVDKEAGGLVGVSSPIKVRPNTLTVLVEVLAGRGG